MLVTTAAEPHNRTIFVSWIRYHGRSDGLCRALPADCAFVAVGRLTDRRTAPLRHAVQALITLVVLIRRRPRTLWIMAPPTPLVVLALFWRAMTRCQLVVDAHTGAVMDSAGRLRSTAWLRRADLVVVTTPKVASSLLSRGVTALALHDPPLAISPRAVDVQPNRVIFPASWYADEPWEDVVAAARHLPHLEVVVTGKIPASVRSGAVPNNLRLTGYLPRAAFEDLLASSAVVLALTTREDTMQRAAYEALAIGRPVVASGTAALRRYLTAGAVFASAGGPSLAQAVQAALDAHGRLTTEIQELRRHHEARFTEQLAAVQERVVPRTQT